MIGNFKSVTTIERIKHSLCLNNQVEYILGEIPSLEAQSSIFELKY